MYEVTFSSAGFNSELIHKTRKVSSLNITKKTKETDENCLGSQIQSNEIRIGDRQELTQCIGKKYCRVVGIDQGKVKLVKMSSEHFQIATLQPFLPLNSPPTLLTV